MRTIESHITAARGIHNLAYIEIGEGPYLVRPSEEAFDNEDRPVNVDRSNIVRIDQPGISSAADGPKVAYLWGNPRDNQLNGSLIRLRAEFSGAFRSRGPTFRTVLIQGRPQYHGPDAAGIKTLEPGSYFGSAGESVHQNSSDAEAQSVVYVRTNGTYEVTPVQRGQ